MPSSRCHTDSFHRSSLRSKEVHVEAGSQGAHWSWCSMFFETSKEVTGFQGSISPLFFWNKSPMKFGQLTVEIGWSWLSELTGSLTLREWNTGMFFLNSGLNSCSARNANHKTMVALLMLQDGWGNSRCTKAEHHLTCLLYWTMRYSIQ